MVRKIGFFILSLWFLFLLMFVITLNYNIKNECNQFIGYKCIILTNQIPLICLGFLILGLVVWKDFSFSLKGTKHISGQITEITNADYEHLSFLTTYIIPLVCFDFEKERYYLVLIILLIIICIIYIRTDIFYANPTLAVLGFRIYKISGSFINNETRSEITLITRKKFVAGDEFRYIKLDEKIYYATKN